MSPALPCGAHNTNFFLLHKHTLGVEILPLTSLLSQAGFPLTVGFMFEIQVLGRVSHASSPNNPWLSAHLQGDAGGWLRDHCLQTGDAFLIVFSVTDRRSFSKVPETLLRLRAGRPHHDLPVILVGNKSDLARSREVSLEGVYPEPVPYLRCKGPLSLPGHLFTIRPFLSSGMHELTSI
jgi:hypothetical protein